MMLREYTWSGPCFDRGHVLRETEQFYIIDPVGFERRRRIKKRISLHTEPCRRCCDHPETDYPRGYDL